METQEGLDTSKWLGELLKNSGQDRQDLEKQLSQLFEDFFGQVLSYIEVALPFEPSKNGVKSENENKFVILRNKILRVGNDKIRLVPTILKYFLIKRIMERREETIIHFGKAKEQVNHE